MNINMSSEEQTGKTGRLGSLSAVHLPGVEVVDDVGGGVGVSIHLEKQETFL